MVLSSFVVDGSRSSCDSIDVTNTNDESNSVIRLLVRSILLIDVIENILYENKEIKREVSEVIKKEKRAREKIIVPDVGDIGNSLSELGLKSAEFC